MDDARLFLCARCQRQVRICSYCDRGNQYCGPACARAARNESLRSAGARTFPAQIVAVGKSPSHLTIPRTAREISTKPEHPGQFDIAANTR